MHFPRAGHFAIYEDSRAQRLYVEFFRTAVDSGTPTLVDR